MTLEEGGKRKQACADYTHVDFSDTRTMCQYDSLGEFRHRLSGILRADADEMIIPCKVIVSKQYGGHGKSNDARNANTVLVSISHLVSSIGVGKIMKYTQTED